MKHVMVLVSLAAALAPAVAAAQPKVEPPAPTVVEIRPAAEPSPALKYRLVPERRELIPGNAAIFYHRAIEMNLDMQRGAAIRDRVEGRTGHESREERVYEWTTRPLSKLPREEIRTFLQPYQRVFKEIEQGARRRSCDWEFEHRDEGWYLVLQEIQETRALARLVVLRTRLAILDGRTDEAFAWIRNGFTLGRHASQGPILIQSLVGMAISAQMGRCLEELIQAPGTPNLYWAIANRPRPFIDLKEALEGERYMLEDVVPAFQRLASGPWTAEQARQFTADLQSKVFTMFDVPMRALAVSREPTNPPTLSEAVPNLALAAVVAKVYPEAKRALIAEGRPAAEVEAMPAIQVVMLVTYQDYNRNYDNIYKWLGLRYRDAHTGLARGHSDWPRSGGNPLSSEFVMLIPSVNGALLGAIRLDRQLDALQCIEAIRLYAAAHDGTLPPNLEAMEEAPAPLDPATGKPFVYTRGDAKSATLEAPLIPHGPYHPSYMLRYQLKVVR